MFRTRYGVSLDALTTRLSGFAADDDLQGSEWAKAATEAFLLTPGIWPLSDELFEMLLGWAGVDLDVADGVEFAVAISQYLEGTGICPIVCTHPTDDPSPRCARVRNGDLAHVYDHGVLFDGTHDRDFWLELRTRLAGVFAAAVNGNAHATDLDGDGDGAETRDAGVDAEEPDTDQEYPDAA